MGKAGSHSARADKAGKAILLSGILGPALLVLLAFSLFPDPSYVNARLDSIVSELRAYLLVTVASLLFLVSREPKNRASAVLAWGFLLTAVPAILDSTTEVFATSLWLKVLEGLQLGLLFAVRWEETSFFPRTRLRYAVGLILSLGLIVITAVAYLSPQYLPVLGRPEGMGTFAVDLYLIDAGILLAASLNGVLRGLHRLSLAQKVFLNFGFTYGFLCFTRVFVTHWHLRWWVLQLAFLLPLLQVLLYLFLVFLRLQQEVVEANRKLQATNQELENFAYIASHDLQEPLRMVTSYLNLLSRRYGAKLDQEAREFIAFAVDGANRMKELITDLLCFSRLEKEDLKLSRVDCGRIVSRVLHNLQVTIRDTAAEVTVGPLPQVDGSESQLAQVFQNLLSNSLKFHGEGPPRIQVSAALAPKSEEWIFTVRDNGIGFEQSDAERIFLLFHRLRGRGDFPGSGIGLATCRKIVERHGGRIWATGEPGKGATFYFSMPASPAREQAPSPFSSRLTATAK